MRSKTWSFVVDEEVSKKEGRGASHTKNCWSCGRLLHDTGLPVAFGQGKSGTGWMKMAKLQFATSAEHLVAAPGATKVRPAHMTPWMDAAHTGWWSGVVRDLQ